jgi:predicted ATP-grasp superfamily ATP-dependent carboligase
MKKVLIVGGGHAELPLIRELKSHGYFVGTVGNNKDGLGHKIADSTEFLDFSNEALINDYFRNNCFDFVVPGCNDFAMITAAYIAEKNNIGNFDSLELTTKLHHKNSFREICRDLNLNSPKAESFNNVEEAISYVEKEFSFEKSLIVKPIDLTGGKGISKITRTDDYKLLLTNAFNRSKVKTIVIEDFIDGTNHGFSCFVINNKIDWFFWDNEYYYIDNYSVAGTSYPGSSSEQTLLELKNQLEKLSFNLGLADGLLHVQYIDNNGKPFIVEVMRRPPGDLYLNFVEESSLTNYTKLIIDFFIDKSIYPQFSIKKDNFYYARHCVKGFKKGIVKRIKYSKELKPYILKGFDIWDNNQYLEDFLTQKLSIILLKFDNIELANEFNNNLYKYIDVQYHQE